MPSKEEIRRAFALFDANGDGVLSLDELKAILCRPTPQQPPLSEARAEQIMKELDTNGDGQLSIDELAAGWATLSIGSLLASAKEAPPSFAALIDVGTVVPDEHDGPYALRSYHANVSGEFRGYKARAGCEAWHATNEAIMARQTSWATIDFEAEDAVDPEYMFTYGEINGSGVDMSELRPVVIEAQAAMKAGYGAAFESARSKQGAAAAFERITALLEKSGKVQQPGGKQLDLVGLYKGALGAVGELWAYGQRAIAASGEAGVAASWGIKKAKRIWFKLHNKYGGDVSRVTDCARISLEFATAEGLERAAKFVLQSASTFKNRMANPTDEGYRDLMFTVLIDGHVCEVQLHLVEMIKAKKSGAGHKMYKVCRRVLNAPIVKEDTYCLEVVGKELRGEGEVNAHGEEEGRGTLVMASGNMYEGQWRAGKFHGQGKYTDAIGGVYEGGFVEDKMHGHGKHIYSIGDVYEGEWVAGKQHGHGKMVHADGESYEGEWVDEEKHGKGTETYADGSSYVGEWEKDEKHGKGTYTNADGDSYEGEWAEGNKHGKGTETYASGASYEGEWADGKIHGKGTYTFASGASYEGEYAEGKKHGKGTYTYADGDSYEGEWAEDKQHGKGTCTEADGAVGVGRFEAGAPVGQGVKWSADRTEAWELQDGEEVRGIPLDEAAQIAERIGLPPP